MKKPTNFKWENLVKQEQYQNGIDVLLSLSLVGEKIQMKSTSSYISINNSSYGHLEQFFEYLFFFHIYDIQSTQENKIYNHQVL